MSTGVRGLPYGWSPPDLAPSTAARRAKLSGRVDWPLAAATVALCAFGCLLVWSATRQGQIEQGLDPNAYLKRQVISLLVGGVAAVAVALVDYRLIRAYAPLLFAASLVALGLVLAVGTTINGARSWIVLPAGFQLQPSEFAKVALIVVAAMILGEKRDDARVGVVSTPGGGALLLVLLLAVLPLGLVMLQPDFGTAMVFVFIVLGMLAVSGAPARWVTLLVASGVAFGAAVLRFDLLEPYQEARLTDFLSRSDVAASTIGYNVQQALVANANGGVLGQGLLSGSQTQGQFVPEQKTDFVFTVAGEELGFLGAGLLLALLGFVLWRALTIAQRSEDRFGTLVCVGVVAWFAFQGFVNIGMTLGLMPVTGLPLPFVSYGGSAMLANLLAFGLVQNVHMRTRR